MARTGNERSLTTLFSSYVVLKSAGRSRCLERTAQCVLFDEAAVAVEPIEFYLASEATRATTRFGEDANVGIRFARARRCNTETLDHAIDASGPLDMMSHR